MSDFTYEDNIKNKNKENNKAKKAYRYSMPNFLHRRKFIDLDNETNVNIIINPRKTKIIQGKSPELIKEENENINEGNKSIHLNNQDDNEMNFDENINSNYNYNKSNGKIPSNFDINEKENDSNNININNSKDIIDKPYNTYNNNNISSEYGNNRSKKKLNSTLNISGNKENDNISNNLLKIKRNTMNSLQYPNSKKTVNNSKSNDINNHSLNIDKSNGQKNKNDLINWKNNNKFVDEDSNYVLDNDKQIVTPINKLGNRNSKNFENNYMKSETDKFLKIKSETENNNRQSIKEINNTEEYLENNLESDNNTLNKENSKKEESNFNKNSLSENSDTSSSNEYESEENIQVKKIIPNCYINKVRHSDSKINKLIPPKKRVFISKLINPHELKHDRNNAEFLSIPILKKCYITNQYIIQNTDRMFRTKINKCYFTTKISLKKGENEERLNNILNIKKMPKVYKKSVITSDKNTLLRKKSKSNKHMKYPNVIDITNKNNNIEININKDKKDKKRKERISLVSKDKDKDPYLKNLNNIIEKENEKNRNSNLIIKQNNNIIKELDSDSNKNNIDISILFSNKEILKKTRKIKKYPSSAKKNHKNLVASLYKDLHDINKKYNNDEYLKKNYLNMHYDKHVGDEETCPICRQVRKRGRKSEREKGLFSAFSFRNMNINNINKKSLSKLKISLQQKFKEREKETNLWNNFIKKKKLKENNLNNYLSSMNNNDDDSDFKKKYMQFNGMNRIKKLRRYGSCDNFVYSECFSHNNNDNKRNLKLNMNKEVEKNHDEMNKFEYPALNNYFHDD